MLRKFARRRRRQSGQATIFMALFMGTMILLFAFTTNIGMLVHAKINLQNAADAAAYAGAAVQARQLTNASYLNWEMRRALKEFLFLYMVRGSYAQACFPRDSTGAPGNPDKRGGCIAGLSGLVGPGAENRRYPFVFYDPGTNPAVHTDDAREDPELLIPSVCVIFDTDNNYCQKGGVPGVAQVAGGAFGVADPIVASVRNAVQNITGKKIRDCEDISDVNNQFLFAWLFNLEPLKPPVTAANSQSSDDPFDVSGLDGLGVLPRMAILRARLDNIEDSLNLNLRLEGFSSASVDDEVLSEINSKAGASGLLYYERPIQAYLSAKNNLPSLGENGIFSEVALSELLPTTAGNVSENEERIDENPPVLVKFNNVNTIAHFATSQFQTASGTQGGLSVEGRCIQNRFVTAVAKFPLGITKDPNVVTYYAVQLQAKARLLFSPFGASGRVTLSAYSAAKPFGSRIGRDLTKDPFGMMVGPIGLGRLQPGSAPILGDTKLLNVPITDENGDRSEVGGFSRNDHLGYLRGAMEATGRRDWGFRLAGAYAPWEVGFYTPPANYQAPQPIGAFPDNPDYSNSSKENRFDLAVPLLPFKNPGAGLGFIFDKIQNYLLSTSVNDGTNRFPDLSAAGMPLAPDRFDQLFAFLQSKGLLDNHLIPDPLLNDVPVLLNHIRNDPNGAKFTVAAMPDAQRRQLTSWNNYKTAADPDASLPSQNELSTDMGRSGYSVRFVSFASLMAGGQSVRGDPNMSSDNFSNPFDRLGADAAGARILDDLSKIKH